MKARRQMRLLEIIRRQNVTTQEELARALSDEGIPVTQATISRDIRELNLMKIPTGDGRTRYVAPDALSAPAPERMRRLFREAVLSIDSSENIIVVKAITATAPGVASAIDSLGWPEIIGTVAGDDTVMVVVKPASAVPSVMRQLHNLID